MPNRHSILAEDIKLVLRRRWTWQRAAVFLSQHYSRTISARTVQRRALELGLYRRATAGMRIVAYSRLVRQVTDSPHASSGVRKHKFLLLAGSSSDPIDVGQHWVNRALRKIDPAGIARRRRTRLKRRVYFAKPHFVWHVDANLKLTPRYRIVLSGAIDGGSHRIAWLRAAGCNTSQLVLRYWLEAIGKLGRPALVRCDLGPENVLMCFEQQLAHNRYCCSCSSTPSSTTRF